MIRASNLDAIHLSMYDLFDKKLELAADFDLKETVFEVTTLFFDDFLDLDQCCFTHSTLSSIFFNLF